MGDDCERFRFCVGPEKSPDCALGKKYECTTYLNSLESDLKGFHDDQIANQPLNTEAGRLYHEKAEMYKRITGKEFVPQ